MKKLMKRLRGNRGQSMVEFAIIVPVVLLMFLGLIEWGFVMWTQTMYVNAARDGARRAVVMQDWNTNAAADADAVVGVVVGRLSALPPALREGIESNITVTLLPSAADIRSIRVSITDQPYAPVLGLTMVPVPETLSSDAEFHLEGATCVPGSC